MTAVMRWTPRPAPFLCWADRRRELTGMVADCLLPADTGVGLCAFHYRVLIGRRAASSDAPRETGR